MLQQTGTCAVVYQVLDQVLADGAVTPSSRSAMFSVIDELRQCATWAEDLRRAESISIEMHKLDWALLKGEPAKLEAALRQLRELATNCLNSRICS